MQFERGFTLLEILVALSIAVVGISAIVKSAGGAIDILQSSEDRSHVRVNEGARRVIRWKIVGSLEA